jgi:hypothetical protein
MRLIYLFQAFLLALSMSAHAMTSEEAIKFASMHSGKIIALNLQENTIKIDQKSFKLADQVSIKTADDTLISKVLLMPGLQVDYWTLRATQSGQDEVIKIKVTSKLNKNAYER